MQMELWQIVKEVGYLIILA